MRHFRSLLYAPADDRTLVDRAVASSADALILDLEDRVAADRKRLSRRMAADTVGRLGERRVMYVRVNPADSGLLGDDLDAVIVAGLEAIRVPKVEAADEVRAIDEQLAEIETRRGLPIRAIGLSLGLESANAVRLAFELCSASSRVTSVAVGLGHGGDLQRDVGYVPGADGDETLYIRSKVVVDARAAGVPIPLDGGFGTYRTYDRSTEEARFLASAESGRRLGYRAKICFHPEQADAINRIFGDAPA